ncbi:MAG: Nif3-like dinuclear metal center hexameric protein [Pseudomonadota bacterium]|nr:Nif3-like dinuclear metal center hexameric protein [Pseudomonadota bacterium]
MIRHDYLEEYIADLLNVTSLKDYCPNGLQVEGKKNIAKIVAGVSLNSELIEKAIELSADAIFVHHGIFWYKEESVLKGVKKQRLEMLLKHNINLFAYHLPLDIDKTYGNNKLLGDALGWDITTYFPLFNMQDLGVMAELPEVQSVSTIFQHLAKTLDREPMHIPTKVDSEIRKVAWCTGAAEDGIECAAKLGADAYMSGEVSERTYHLARELGIHYFAIGHHASECYCVRALGEHLSQKFNLEYKFLNVYNPI